MNTWSTNLNQTNYFEQLSYNPLLNSSLALSEFEKFVNKNNLTKYHFIIQFAHNSEPTFNPSSFFYYPEALFFKIYEQQEEKNILIPSVMPINEAKEFYEKNKEKLLETYKNKYIAIIDKNSLKMGDDLVSLAKSVYGQFGYQDVFITKVTSEDEVIRLTRPRLIK